MDSHQVSRHFRKLSLMTGMSALLLTAVAVPGTAFAQDEQEGVRYTKKTKSASAKSGLLNTKFKDAQKAQEKEEKRPQQMMSGSDFSRKREVQAQALIDKKIELTKRLLQSSDPKDPEYPDLLYRLADHFLEKKAFFDMQAGALYEQIYAAEDKGQKSKAKQLAEKQKRLQREKLEMSKQAAKVYATLVTKPEFRSYKKMDEALFFYAFELGELKQESLMTKVYQKLISEYPNSQYIPQAYLAFADFYYSKDEIQKAVRLYERVTTFKDSPVYAFALYMLGWCHLNPLGSAEPRYDKSLAYFIETIQATQQGRAGNEENARSLRRDSRRDLIRAYVHASKPSAAWGFFTKWGNGPGKDENDARRMMLLLANGYFGEGMYAESTYIYKQLQELFPDDEETCAWQGKVVVNTLATDNKVVQWNETEALSQMWENFSKKKVSKQAKKQCRDEVLNTTKQMATVWHDEASKTHRADTYELAEKAYNRYLTQFPDDKDAYELQYFYGELLWDLADQHYSSKDQKERQKGLEYFKQAHDVYLKALEKNPKGKLTKDLAQAQMLAMKNHLEYDETGGKGKACKTNHEGVCIYDTGKKRRKKRDKDTKEDVASEYPVTDYTPEEKMMLESYDIYTKYVDDKNDEELPKIMYHRASLMFSHNRFDEARPLLEELIVKFDGQVYAAWCSEMLVDLLTIKWVDKDNDLQATLKASADLEEWARKLQGMKTWQHPDADRIREAIPTLLAGIGWKEAKAYGDAGTAYVKGQPGGDPKGFKKCAEKYLEVFNEFENHPDGAALLYSGAICAQAGYMVSNAITLRKNLLELYPDSQYSRDAHWDLANNYQAVAYYRDAAEQFESFATKYPKDKETPTALQNAYLFRLGLGDKSQAADDIRKYESLYTKKDPEKAAGIFWARFDTLTTDDERVALARDYIKTYGKRGGVDRLIVAHAAIGEILWNQSCKGNLTFNSCLKIERKAALSGAKTVAERKRLEAKQKRVEQAKAKQKFKVPERCGEETHAVITVFDRDPRPAKEAQSHFDTVLKLAREKASIAEGDFQRLEDYRNAIGMAMVFQADQDYEEYLRLTVPTGLSFAVEAWKKGQGVPAWDRLVAKQEKAAEESKKRLAAYSKRKTELAAKLDAAYGKVPDTSGSKYWSLAAAARTGMVMRNFADQLYRAEVPDSFKSEDEYFAYCDALSDMARPAEERAQIAFNYCMSRSTEYQYFNSFSRMCEEEMQQQDPEKFPATNEFFGTSIYTQSRIAKAGVRDSATGDRATTVRRKTSKKESSN